MIALSDLKEWVDEILKNADDPDELGVAVDDGGLTLVVVDETGAETDDLCEVGGIPEEDDDEDEKEEAQ